jgi:hypothetical protein
MELLTALSSASGLQDSLFLETENFWYVFLGVLVTYQLTILKERITAWRVPGLA